MADDLADSPAPARHAKRGAAIDLDPLSLEELIALATVVDAKVREKQEAAKKALIAEFRERAALIGIPFDALMPAYGSPRKGGTSSGKVPVKFRSPKGEEWSGRGRLPTWLADAERAGENRERYKVSG